MQISMDVLAWLEDGQLKKEYSDHLKWKGEFLRYLLGWVTQEEEYQFNILCNDMFTDLTSRNPSQSCYLPVSRGLSEFLRHNQHKNLFSSTGSVELSNIFAYMHNNPDTRRMTGRDFASMLMANDKSRFFVEVYVNWNWNPYGVPPTEPFQIRIGCHQGHSNQTVNPYRVHHVLTPDEACSLGWIFM